NAVVEPKDDVFGTLVQPYVKNEPILACPGDPASKTERETAAGEIPFPPTTEPQRRFNYACTSDFGLNVQYYSPLGANCHGNKTVAISQAQNQKPAGSIYALDSVWSRTATGTPYGGGNYALDPPCRYLTDGTSTFPSVSPCTGRYWFGGWNPGA